MMNAAGVVVVDEEEVWQKSGVQRLRHAPATRQLGVEPVTCMRDGNSRSRALHLDCAQCVTRRHRALVFCHTPLASKSFFLCLVLPGTMQRFDQENHDVTTPLTSTSQFIEAGEADAC